MPEDLEKWLRSGAGSPAKPHSSGAVLDRLTLFANLRRSVPLAAGPRLVWRDQRDGPLALPIVRSVVFGRDPGCELCFKDDEVSRLHCRIRPEGRWFVLEDLESKNGTRLNGSKIASECLRNGDIIEIGSSVAVAFVWSAQARA